MSIRSVLVAVLFVPVAIIAESPEGGSSTDLARGIQLFEAREFGAARKVLEPLASGGKDRGEASFYMGRAFFEESMWAEAAVWLEKAVESDPGSGRNHHWLGRAYGQEAREANFLRKMSLAGKVKSEFRKAVDLDPANLDALHDLITFYIEAPGIAGGDIEEAVRLAGEMKARDALRGHLELGRIHEAGEEPEKAMSQYREAMKVAPDDPRPYYDLGFLQQRSEDFDGAIRTFQALAEAMPSEMGAYYQIGRTGALSGLHLEQAAAGLRKYLEHTPGRDDPSLAWAHFRLAEVYRHMKRLDEARVELESALRLEPDHKEARKALESLR